MVVNWRRIMGTISVYDFKIGSILSELTSQWLAFLSSEVYFICHL